MTAHKPTFANHPSACGVWRPRVKLEPVIWLVSDFSPIGLTHYSGFHYHFIVCLWRTRTGWVTVMMTDRTKTALFPQWRARSQERGELGGQAVNRELMPTQQLTCNTVIVQVPVTGVKTAWGLHYDMDIFGFSHLQQNWFIRLKLTNDWWL